MIENWTEKHGSGLRDIPPGSLLHIAHPLPGSGNAHREIHPIPGWHGRGSQERYALFPGVSLTFLRFDARDVNHRHPPLDSVLEINHCRQGRVGWEMQKGMTLYLGPGDLSLHRMDQCADSLLRFPLEHYEGISLSLNLEQFSLPGPLQDAGLELKALTEKFCPGGAPAALAANDRIDRIFSPLYELPERFRLPYCQVKVQELLLFLALTDPAREIPLDQVRSQQVEIVKAIHEKLTSHLDQRFTIDALAKEYLINTSALKATFKAVYGQPVAAYMKTYRVREAAKLLRETDKSVAEIARAVGYESQSKFTAAFQDVAQILPTAYRRQHDGDRKK